MILMLMGKKEENKNIHFIKFFFSMVDDEFDNKSLHDNPKSRKTVHLNVIGLLFGCLTTDQ